MTLKTNQTLRLGDSSSQVRALQIRLAELGDYTNTIDGAYGYGTRQAVLAFQKNNQLTQDGIAGQQTLEKLASASAVGADDIPKARWSPNAWTGSPTVRTPSPAMRPSRSRTVKQA